MNKEQLAESIYKVSHLTGEFTLRSGQVSNEYFDKYRFEAQPELLQEISRQLAPLVPPGTEALAALEMGGIPIATALSLELGIPCVFVRKEAKKYGTMKLAEGMEIEGKQLCIIEDVITTGGQVIESCSELRERGAKITDVLCVIYRGEGEPTKINNIELKVHHLFTMQELKAHL